PRVGRCGLARLPWHGSTLEMVFTALAHTVNLSRERLVAEATNRANEVLNGNQMHIRPIDLIWTRSRSECFDSGSKRERPRAGVNRAYEEKSRSGKEGSGCQGEVDQGTRKYKEQGSRAC